MISTTIDNAQIMQLKNLLDGNVKKLKREVGAAISKTAAVAKSKIAKQITQELATSQKAIKSTLVVQKKSATANRFASATVIIKKTRRLSLENFGARQTAKGVSYKVSKTEARAFIPSGFMGPKPGTKKSSWNGKAFIRAGTEKTPILKLRGPSPWGVFVKKSMYGQTRAEALIELRKQVTERIRFLKVKKSGAI